MNQPNPHYPQVVASQNGDVLIIQGPGVPVLFFSKAHVATLLKSPESASAVLITDIGAAAVEALLAGNASFEAIIGNPGPGSIGHVTLRLRLPNGLCVAYTTDPTLAGYEPDQLKAVHLDLVVTDRTIGWDRKHLQFIGDVISQVADNPPMPTFLRLFDAKALSRLVRDALAQRAPGANSETNGGSAS